MPFIFHRRFKKKFKRLSPQIREQFFDRLKIFIVDPFNVILNNHSVGESYDNCRSINITGNVRALYEVHGNVAVFVNIGSHSDLY
jgi:mRNA-degrading endonuclease YafQ of YafQ-DinJ toxin-antitoxin module